MVQIKKSYTNDHYIAKKDVQYIRKGPLQTQYKNFTKGINATGDNVSFSALDPPIHSLLSRQIMLSCYMRVDVVAAANGVAPVVLTDFFPRSYPLNRAISNIRLAINGRNITANVGKNLDAMAYYNNSLEDRVINYNSVEVDRVHDYTSYTDSALDPGNDANLNKRSFEVVKILNETNGVAGAKSKASILVKLTEPLVLPLLKYSHYQDEEMGSFFNITNLAIDINFHTGKELTRRILGSNKEITEGESQPLAAPGAQTVSQVLFATNSGATDKAQIQCRIRTATPNTEAGLKLLPKFDQNCYYNYLYHQEKARETKAIAGIDVNSLDPKLVSTPIIFNNFVLGAMFDQLYIYGRLTESDPLFRLTDANSFCRITGCTITLGNDPSNFTTYLEEDLYRICAKNGLKFGRGKLTLTGKGNITDVGPPVVRGNRWDPGMGTILCLRPEDFNLPVDFSGGIGENMNISITIHVTGLHKDVGLRNYEFIAQTAHKSVLSVSNAQSEDRQVQFSKEQVLAAPIETESHVFSKALSGGGKRIGGNCSGGAQVTVENLEELM